jgi:hypothetical protein
MNSSDVLYVYKTTPLKLEASLIDSGERRLTRPFIDSSNSKIERSTLPYHYKTITKFIIDVQTRILY